MDIWTDGFQKIPYLAFLLHYGHDFVQKEILLDIASFQVSHTGDAIHLEVKKILAEYGLDVKKMRMVSDSASNNILASRILDCHFRTQT